MQEEISQVEQYGEYVANSSNAVCVPVNGAGFVSCDVLSDNKEALFVIEFESGLED